MLRDLTPKKELCEEYNVLFFNIMLYWLNTVGPVMLKSNKRVFIDRYNLFFKTSTYSSNYLVIVRNFVTSELFYQLYLIIIITSCSADIVNF